MVNQEPSERTKRIKFLADEIIKYATETLGANKSDLPFVLAHAVVIAARNTEDSASKISTACEYLNETFYSMMGISYPSDGKETKHSPLPPG